MGHVCKKKELRVLIVGDGEKEKAKQGDDKELGPMGISLNSVVGIDNPRTMKLEGKIKGSKVVVMIDPEATHDFISPEIVRQLGIREEPTEEFGVTLATGETRNGKERCREVEFDLGAICSNENFLPLELGHTYVILGIEWLAKLGTISTNWKNPLMSFCGMRVR